MMHTKKLLGILLTIVPIAAYDLITVYNKTLSPIYVRTYCTPILFNEKIKAGPLYEIPAKDNAQIERPEKKIDCSRQLVFSFHKQELKDELTKKEFNTLSSLGIGFLSDTGLGLLPILKVADIAGNRAFSDFYIVRDRHGVLRGYNPIGWLPYEALEKYEQSLVAESSLINNNPYKNQQAQVRVGPMVSDGERNYLRQREQIVKDALERFLGKKLNGSYIPKIACINSGGGVRSFICCLGWHLGAIDIGLLDAITYDIGLSGGAWFVNSWMASGKSLTEFKATMQPLINNDLIPNGSERFTEAKRFLDAIALRDALDQPVTLVNAWGGLLANRYLGFYGASANEVLFSSHQDRVSSGQLPLPIVTAASGYSEDHNIKRHLMHWFEWTPYEASAVGNWLGNAHIPTWAFGREYKNGYSVDFKPEYDVALLMGICGSAFAFSYARGYEETIRDAISKMPIFSDQATRVLDYFMEELFPEGIKDRATGTKISVGKAPNFAPNNKKSEIRLVDAGIAFNLPIPPALTRQADVLLVCDASGGDNIGSELLFGAEYAKAHGYAFPQITVDDVTKKNISIFTSHDIKAPLVLYMTRVDPSGKVDTNFSTAKFNYSPGEFESLSGFTQAAMHLAAPDIKQALIDLIARHNGFTKE